MVTLDFALDTVMQLPQVEREDLLEVLKKRQSQEWRKDTALYYQELKESISNGDLKPVTAKEAIAELHDFIRRSKL